MSSARRLYRVNVALAALGGATAIAAALIALTRLEPMIPPAHALAAACRGAVASQSSLAAAAVVTLATLGVVAATLGFRSLLRHLKDQRRVLASLDTRRTLEIAGQPVVVIADRRPRAFCAGLLRPRIYLSEPALSLPAAELAAVLAHEGHHRANRDPLRVLLVQVFADALFFLPGLVRLARRYRELAELAADEAATEASTGEALASALLTFGERSGEAAAVVGIAPERVDHLLGDPPRWRVPASAFGGSLITLAMLMAAAVALPGLVAAGSLSITALMAQGCMVAMVAVPLILLAAAVSRSRGLARR